VRKNIIFILLVLSVLQCGAAVAESLYSEQAYSSLTSDKRSFRRGQILTVLVYEAASASSSTDTNTNKATDVGMSMVTTNKDKSADLSINSDFTGGGALNRSGKFVTTVSVTITDITEDNELVIAGEQVLEFNNETQKISVEGKVRKEDIDADNTIISTRIADAKIKYLGDGLLSDRERPGIITRFFNWLF